MKRLTLLVVIALMLVLIPAVASADEVGAMSSLVVANGKPAISYRDRTNESLKYVISLDPNGVGWDTPQTLDDPGNVGEFTSLAIINGTPAISYYDKSNGDLKYIHAQDADGTNWNTPETSAVVVPNDVTPLNSSTVAPTSVESP